MSFHISDIFLIIAIFQLCFLSFLLFFEKRGNRISHRLLAAFFFLLSLNLTDGFLLFNNGYKFHPSYGLWTNNFPLLYGPLLYLYTQSILYNEFRLSVRKWIHFLPFILFTLFFETFYLSYSVDDQTNILNKSIAGKVHPVVYWITPLIACHFLIYIIFCLRMLQRYEKSASEKYSDPKQVNLSWLSSTILFFLFFMAFLSLNSFIRMTVLSGYYNVLLNFIILAIFIFVNHVLFKAFKTPEIFSLITEKEVKEFSSINQPVKYKSSVLTEEEKQRILQLLLVHMDNKKPFLEPELSLDQLASPLSLKSKFLSQAINELLKKNFFSFGFSR